MRELEHDVKMKQRDGPPIRNLEVRPSLISDLIKKR